MLTDEAEQLLRAHTGRRTTEGAVAWIAEGRRLSRDPRALLGPLMRAVRDALPRTPDGSAVGFRDRGSHYYVTDHLGSVIATGSRG